MKSCIRMHSFGGTTMRPQPKLRRCILTAGGFLTLGTAAAGFLTLRSDRAAAAGASEKALDSNQTILHVLNRLAFGPRPGDADAVRSIGIHRWIDQQLHPDTIDDSAAQGKLANLTSL